MRPTQARGDRSAFRILLLSPALVDEPLGTMYLAAALREAGFAVEGMLFNHADRTERDVVDLVRVWDPHVVAISVITGEHLQCSGLARALRDAHEHVTVMGGPFCTFAPESLLEMPHVDAVARGDCEHAIVDLCDRLHRGVDHTDVANLWVRAGDRIVENPLGPLPSLDELPHPDRDLFRAEKADGVYNLVTSRGCPYKCTYCFNDRFVALYRPRSRGGARIGEAPSPTVRNRSLDDVIAEMAALDARFDVEQFNFHDDIFPIRRSRTLEFCAAYAASGIGRPWSCSVKGELLDRELVEAMAEAGCSKVYMGVEAGDDGVRNDLLLRRVTRAQMVEAAALVRAAGIQLFTQSMVGLPGTGLEDDVETMRFNAELRPSFAWVSIFTPYPGTALAERAHALGLVEPDFMTTMPNTYHYRSVLQTPHAGQVGLLHKLFSLGVEHPELIPAIQALVERAPVDDLDALHEQVFLPFRSWKHDLLRAPGQPPPTRLAHIVDALRDGDLDQVLRVVRDAGPVMAGGTWPGRDGVDATLGPRPSADRRSAEP